MSAALSDDPQRDRRRKGRGARAAEIWRRVAEQHARRFACFGAVGVSGILVRTAVLWALVTHLGVQPVIAATVGSEVSILTNFVLNDRWTFADAQPGISFVRRAAHYNAVAFGSTVLSLVLFAVLTERLALQYLLANVIAIGAATLANYVINRRITWALHLQRSPRMLGSDAAPTVAGE
jgi:putative flippase GtrA